MYKVDAFTAIIVAPQAAILAVGRIADRVVPVDGKPGIRPMMTLTLSCDHRVFDGARAALFLNDLAASIVEPEKLLSDRLPEPGQTKSLKQIGMRRSRPVEALDSRRITMSDTLTTNPTRNRPEPLPPPKRAVLHDAMGTGADRSGPGDRLRLPQAGIRGQDEAARRWFYPADHHGDHGHYFLHGGHGNRRHGRYEESGQDRRQGAALL